MIPALLMMPPTVPGWACSTCGGRQGPAYSIAVGDVDDMDRQPLGGLRKSHGLSQGVSPHVDGGDTSPRRSNSRTSSRPILFAATSDRLVVVPDPHRAPCLNGTPHKWAPEKCCSTAPECSHLCGEQPDILLLPA